MTRLARLARLIVVFGLVAVVVTALTPPGRVAVKTLLLLPDMFPSSPVRPLTWITAEPRVEDYSFDFPAGHIDADVYYPTDGGRHGALILMLGAVGYPRRDPTLVRFADGLSRAGAVVMIPESSNLQQGEILPGEVDGLLMAVDYLRSRPEVDPERVGFLGFSVGGSMALLAAEAERGRDTVAFVNAFGAYYDLTELLVSIASQTIVVDGQTIPWQPAELTVWVFAKQLIGPLPDPRDREILRAIYIDKEPISDGALDELSPNGRLVVELLSSTSRERARAIVSELSPELRERLAAISPSSRIERLDSALYVMHDLQDGYIPFTQSQELVARAPPGVVRAHTVFDLFAHVTPDRPVESLQFAREVLKLYHHAWLFCREFL